MIASVLTRLRRWTPQALVILSVLIFALMLWGGFVGVRAKREDETAVRDRAKAEMNEAGSRAAGAATEAVAALGEREADRRVREMETRDDILAMPDAKTSAGAAGHAGLVGLCRRALYRDNPRCAGLRGADSAATAR